MNVLVVFTGGTIGSSESCEVVDIEKESHNSLFSSYFSQSCSKDVSFDTSSPHCLLSENMTPSDWMPLILSLNSVDDNLYDGIIVLHGTDTLPYSAAAVSFGIKKCNIPIVFVSSNYPLGDVRSNGLSNFTNALNFISNYPVKGVFVVFENSNKRSFVHIGSRLCEADSFVGDFQSFNGVYFGEIKDGLFLHNKDKRNVSLGNLKNYNFNKRRLIKLDPSSDVLYIKPFVGLNYRYFNFEKTKPSCVIHDMYHSGTLNGSNSSNNSINEFVLYCEKYNVPILFLRKDIGKVYFGTKVLIDSGANFIVSCSLESSIVKFILNTYEDNDEFDKEVYFEYVR